MRWKMGKADWMVTGQFSLDDRNQLFLEVTDLQHADVLASDNYLHRSVDVTIPNCHQPS